MRWAILFGFLVIAIGCSDNGTGPSDTVDPGPPQFEAVGDYYLFAVQDSLIAHDAVSTASSYIDECIGAYTLLVGPGGYLSLYADSTYRLRYTEKIVIDPEPHRFFPPDTLVDLAGQWTATGAMYDTLSLTDYWRQMLDWTGPWWLRNTSPMYRLDILRGVLRGEEVDLYFDQPFAYDSLWDGEQGGAWSIFDNSFKLTFLRS